MDKDKEKEKEKEKVDPIVAPLGDLGRWQFCISMLVFLSKVPTGTVTLSTVFFTAPIKTKCTGPVNITDPCSDDCEDVEYDTSIFEDNIITEYDLICDRKELAKLSQTIVMFGILVGSMTLGVLSDKYGRRPAFVYICLIQCVVGLIVSLSPSFWFFCFFRFLDAVAVGGIMVTSFVIIMEIVGKSKREVMSILYQLPFNVGHASLPLVSYFLRTWRWYNFGFSIFSVIYIIYLCLIPESPRWLLARGRVEEATAILEYGAKVNGKPTENIKADLEAAFKVMSANAPVKKGNMADLFRYPNLRKKSIIMAFDWLVVCMVYYGVAQYISGLGGNIFLNVFISAILGVPGTIICVPMTKYVGRRITLILSNLISTIGLLGLAVFTLDAKMQVVLATIGLFGASVTFPNVYLYGGELFPTVVRNSGVGMCSMVGRIGSMVAPFISGLSDKGIWIPPFIMGLFSLAAAILTMFLPETKGSLLPETIQDGENFGKKAE